MRGRLILEILRTSNGKHTKAYLVNKVAKLAGVDPCDVEDKVEETLHGGIRHGYLQYTKGKYYEFLPTDALNESKTNEIDVPESLVRKNNTNISMTSSDETSFNNFLQQKPQTSKKTTGTVVTASKKIPKKKVIMHPTKTKPKSGAKSGPKKMINKKPYKKVAKKVVKKPIQKSNKTKSKASSRR